MCVLLSEVLSEVFGFVIGCHTIFTMSIFLHNYENCDVIVHSLNLICLTESKGDMA